MTNPDVSFVKNQPVFHALGFNPIKEQWQFAVVIGGESFDYSGGLWAFVPQSIKRTTTPLTGSRDASFSPREAIKKEVARFPNSRLASTVRMIEQGRIKIAKNWNDSDVRQYVTLIGKFNRPEKASIFYALLSDMDAGEMSFQDFCDTFGANNDSIKDLETHQACQRNARKFRAIVTTEEIAKLREVLQNY